MNDEQFEKVRFGPGFIAALDQSGGSTPKALALYGMAEDSYSDDDEMFAVMHEMPSRIVMGPRSSQGGMPVGPGSEGVCAAWDMS